MPVDTSRQEARALRSGWMPRRGRAEAAPGPHRAGGATELQPVAQRLGAAWPGFRSFRGSEEALISFPMETFIPLLAAAPCLRAVLVWSEAEFSLRSICLETLAMAMRQRHRLGRRLKAVSQP